MARRRVRKPEGLEAFLSHKPARRGRGERRAPLDLAVEDARQRAKLGHWSKAPATALVGLYAVCHELVHKVEPAELRNVQTWKSVHRLAVAMLRRDFDSDTEAMAEFVRWCWLREQSRATYNLEHGREPRRLRPMVQFGGSLLSDYRAAMEARRRM